jgi:hypothetical protein
VRWRRRRSPNAVTTPGEYTSASLVALAGGRSEPSPRLRTCQRVPLLEQNGPSRSHERHCSWRSRGALVPLVVALLAPGRLPPAPCCRMTWRC